MFFVIVASPTPVDGAWTEEAILSGSAFPIDFGRSVSVSGDTALMGASRDDDAGSRSGSAYTFEP